MTLRKKQGDPELEQLYRELSGTYDLSENLYVIGGKLFSFMSVQDSYALLDRISPEEFLKDEQMPYWAEIWPAAVALSSFIAEDLRVADLRIVELGAGVGMVSIVAAACGASVLATDYSLEALRFVSCNARLNGVELTCDRLDWRLVQCSEQFDMLLAADVLYERVNLLLVVAAIEKLLKPGGVAYVADPRRRLAEHFVALARENGFSIVAHGRTCDGPNQPVAVTIYGLSRERDA